MLRAKVFGMAQPNRLSRPAGQAKFQIRHLDAGGLQFVVEPLRTPNRLDNRDWLHPATKSRLSSSHVCLFNRRMDCGLPLLFFSYSHWSAAHYAGPISAQG
jgi:hypothetical protein